MDEQLAEARLRFLTSEPVQPHSVRHTILASWMRSRRWNLPADRIDLPYIADPDLELPLARSANPVLQRLHEYLGGQPISVILTDRTHVINLGYSIRLPDVKSGGMTQALLGGWQVSGVTTFVSGAALTAQDPNLNIQGTDRNGTTLNGANISGSADVGAFPVILCDPNEGVPSGYYLNLFAQ